MPQGLLNRVTVAVFELNGINAPAALKGQEGSMLGMAKRAKG